MTFNSIVSTSYVQIVVNNFQNGNEMLKLVFFNLHILKKKSLLSTNYEKQIELLFAKVHQGYPHRIRENQ